MAEVGRIDHPTWFNTREIEADIYLTTEDYYYAGNRSNIWLIRGTNRDVLIDTGLGVCNLKKHLQNLNLLSNDRECVVICTHSHFDHSGGAHHFDHVLIHEDDYQGLKNGDKSATLNWSEPSHYRAQPYPDFESYLYGVPPTECTPIPDGYRLNLGDENDQLEIMHVPGHTPGSILCYYPKKKALFTGDFVYECGHGGSLYDWTPRASTEEYLKSAHRMIDWFNTHPVDNIYTGHYDKLTVQRVLKLLNDYIQCKKK